MHSPWPNFDRTLAGANMGEDSIRQMITSLDAEIAEAGHAQSHIWHGKPSGMIFLTANRAGLLRFAPRCCGRRWSPSFPTIAVRSPWRNSMTILNTSWMAKVIGCWVSFSAWRHGRNRSRRFENADAGPFVAMQQDCLVAPLLASMVLFVFVFGIVAMIRGIK